MHDIFISYARRDDSAGWVTAFVAALQREHAAATAGSHLRIFFDQGEIRVMEDWELRVRTGLRSSRLLIACMSPAYFDSRWCRIEWDVYLDYERDCGLRGDGVAPIYFVTAPQLERAELQQDLAQWIQSLRPRQRLDLRPFFLKGPKVFAREDIRLRLAQLDQQIADRLDRTARASQSPTTIPSHNPNFTGRTEELRQLALALQGGRLGSVAAVHGLGGVGKSAVAFEYAHAFATDYPGGRWFLRCEGQGDLTSCLRPLGSMLGFQFSEEEKTNADLAFSRLTAEIRSRSRMLLLLDNVDHASVFDRLLLDQLPFNQVHLLATTRLAPDEIGIENKKCLPLDQLHPVDAIRLLEKHRAFGTELERAAAEEIVLILGGFALSVEAVGVFLRAEHSVDYSGLLARLKAEGFDGIETLASDSTLSLSRHREKLLSAVIAPTLALLSEVERRVLDFAAALIGDAIPLPWLKELVAAELPNELGTPSPGYPDPWIATVRRLDGLRLLTPGPGSELRRLHRLVQGYVSTLDSERDERAKAIDCLVSRRAERLELGWERIENRWELEFLKSWICFRVGLDVSFSRESPTETDFHRRFLQSVVVKAHTTRSLASLNSSTVANVDLAHACTSVGRVEDYLGRLTESHLLLRVAVELWRRSVDSTSPLLAVAHADLATAEYAIGDDDDGEGSKQHSLALLSEIRPRDAHGILSCAKLASLAWESGLRREAGELIDRASDIYRADKHCLDDAQTLFRLFLVKAVIHLEASDLIKGDPQTTASALETARVLCNAVITIAEETAHPCWAALARRFLAAAEKRIGSLPDARELLMAAIDVQENLLGVHHIQLGESYAALAEVQEQLGDFVEARQRWNQAATIGMLVYFPVRSRKWRRWNREAAKSDNSAGVFDQARETLQPNLDALVFDAVLTNAKAKFQGQPPIAPAELISEFKLMAAFGGKGGDISKARTCLDVAITKATLSFPQEYLPTREIAWLRQNLLKQVKTSILSRLLRFPW